MIGWILILILLSVAVFLVSYAIKFVLLPKEVDKLLEKIKNEPLDELIPGKINTLSLPDGHICYENNPSNNPNGETIILLHGLSQTMLSFPKYFWEPLHKAGYNIIRIDQRASGVSSWFKNWGEGNKYTLEDMADDAIKVSKQVGLEKFHLVGMSMGGMISQRVAINHPDKIKSLTSIFSTGYYYDPELKNVPPLFRLKFVLAILMYGRSLKTIDQKINYTCLSIAN